MQEMSSENKDTGHVLNILLIEDTEVDVKIALRAFAKAKLKNQIFVVPDGQEGIGYVRGEGKYQDREKYPLPDLILLDINMPKFDGLQVLKKLKNDIQTNSIPVIMLTTSKDKGDIKESYSGGAAGYIPKPTSYEEFVRLVDGFNFYWQVINKLP